MYKHKKKHQICSLDQKNYLSEVKYKLKRVLLFQISIFSIYNIKGIDGEALEIDGVKIKNAL